MTERISWSAIEDQFLIQNLQSFNLDVNHKIKWLQISQKLNSTLNVDKSGKQCRQRWFNQLQPGLSHQTEWSVIDQEKVCLLQQKYGNKWALIAKQFPGRTDNSIKNYFYSHMRKSLRKINQYLLQHRNIKIYKTIKSISQSIIGKIIALSVGKVGRLKVKNEDIIKNAICIKQSLIKFWLHNFSQQEIQQTISNIIAFSKGCRKVRGKSKKMKNDDQDSSESDADHSEIEQVGQKNSFLHSISPPSNQKVLKSSNLSINTQFPQENSEDCQEQGTKIFYQNPQVYHQIQKEASSKQLPMKDNHQNQKLKQPPHKSQTNLIDYFNENHKDQVYLPFYQNEDHEAIPIYLEDYRVNNSCFNDSLIKDINQPNYNYFKISDCPTYSSNRLEYDISSSQYEFLNSFTENNQNLLQNFSLE